MKTKKLVFTAIFVALVFITTMLVKFPISFGWGYIHFGDVSVILGGMLLGPVFGAIAGAFGSALADYATGYAHYMVATFIIKGLLAFGVGLAYKKLSGEIRSMDDILRRIYHFAIAIIVVVGGYFIADLILANLAIVDLEGGTEMGYALFGLIPNLIQVSFGAFASMVLFVALNKPFNSIYDN